MLLHFYLLDFFTCIECPCSELPDSLFLNIPDLLCPLNGLPHLPGELPLPMLFAALPAYLRSV